MAWRFVPKATDSFHSVISAEEGRDKVRGSCCFFFSNSDILSLFVLPTKHAPLDPQLLLNFNSVFYLARLFLNTLQGSGSQCAHMSDSLRAFPLS